MASVRCQFKHAVAAACSLDGMYSRDRPAVAQTMFHTHQDADADQAVSMLVTEVVVAVLDVHAVTASGPQSEQARMQPGSTLTCEPPRTHLTRTTPGLSMRDYWCTSHTASESAPLRPDARSIVRMPTPRLPSVATQQRRPEQAEVVSAEAPDCNALEVRGHSCQQHVQTIDAIAIASLLRACMLESCKLLTRIAPHCTEQYQR